MSVTHFATFPAFQFSIAIIGIHRGNLRNKAASIKHTHKFFIEG